MTKTYEVEYLRTSYITVTVQAENPEQAAQIAWAEIETLPDVNDAQWAIESIGEAGVE